MYDKVLDPVSAVFWHIFSSQLLSQYRNKENLAGQRQFLYGLTAIRSQDSHICTHCLCVSLGFLLKFKQRIAAAITRIITHASSLIHNWNLCAFHHLPTCPTQETKNWGLYIAARQGTGVIVGCSLCRRASFSPVAYVNEAMNSAS